MNTADSASAKKILTSFKSILFLGLPGMKATLSIVMTIGHRQELNSPKKENNKYLLNDLAMSRRFHTPGPLKHALTVVTSTFWLLSD